MLERLPIHPHLLFLLMVTIMATMAIVIRIKSSHKPTSAKKILLPPLGMSTGFVMFLYPKTHIPLTWAILAFLAGAIFLAIPLIITSKFQIIENKIYLKPSRSFFYLLVLLLVVRLSFHSYIEQYISLYQTAGLFFMLAFGMLLPWRVAMYVQFKKFAQQLKAKQTHP